MKRPVLALIAVLGLVSLACGLLDEDAATVTYEEGIPFDFPVDANELCADAGDSDVDCDDDAEPAPEDIELDPIDVSTDIDIVEATGNDNLEDIGQRLRTLTITGIDYEVVGNDLTFDLPEVDVFVGPIGVDDPDAEETVHLTTIPSTPAGENVTPAESADVEGEQRREAASDIFKEMEFAAMGRAQPVVKEGQDFPPSGDAEIELTINIKIQANPTDEL